MADTQDQAPTPSPEAIQDKPVETAAFNVSDWVKKFSASEKIMKAEFFAKYNLAKSRVRSDRDIKNRNSRTKLTHENVSLAYSIGQNYINSIYFKSPNVNLTAREEQDARKVELTEVKVNDWLKDKKVKKTIKRILWDAYEGGLGVRFMDHEYDDMDGEVIGFEKAQMFDPNSQQVVEVDDETKPIKSKIVIKNEVVLKRIRPDLVRFPKGFDLENYQDSPWIGFDVILPLQEVKGNTDWDEAVRGEIEGDRYSKLSASDKGDDSGDTDDLYAKISYVFERNLNNVDPVKLTIFCGSSPSGALKETVFDIGVLGYPIKFIYHNPLDDDYSYPPGDCWLIESQLSAIDTWWRKTVNHAAKSNPKRLYDSSALSDKEVSNLKANNDLEWVGAVNKDRRDIRTFVTDVQAPLQNPSMDSMYEVASQLISKIAPKSALAQGAPDTKSGTATEAKIIATGDMIDVEARIDDVRDFITDIVLDYIGILEKSFIAPVSLRVGEEENSQVIEADKDSFTSKVTVDVDVESMQAMNKDMYRKQVIDTIGILTNFEPIMNKAGMTIDPKFLTEKLLENINIRNSDKAIMPLPPMPVPVVSGQPVPSSSPSTSSAVPDEVALAAAQEPQLR